MSNKDIKKDSNHSPEQLEDKDLDQVNGGEDFSLCYEKIKVTYRSNDATANTKGKIVNITAGAGVRGI